MVILANYQGVKIGFFFVTFYFGFYTPSAF